MQWKEKAEDAILCNGYMLMFGCVDRLTGWMWLVVDVCMWPTSTIVVAYLHAIVSIQLIANRRRALNEGSNNSASGGGSANEFLLGLLTAIRFLFGVDCMIVWCILFPWVYRVCRCVRMS